MARGSHERRHRYRGSPSAEALHRPARSRGLRAARDRDRRRGRDRRRRRARHGEARSLSRRHRARPDLRRLGRDRRGVRPPGGPGHVPVMAELTAAHRAFLAEKRFAVVGTNNPDGSAHLADMWYRVDGDDIVVNSAQGRIKDRNLAADPRMSVVVEDEYRWIRVDGRARIEHDQSITHEDIRRLATRYYGDERKVADAMRDNFSKQHRITYRLPIRRIAGEGL